MSERILDKLRKILALTESPVEHEAAAAMATLQRLLTDHNLAMSDVETRTVTAKPQIREEGPDLGKAAFEWKLSLAEVMAEHYFCYALVNRHKKGVKFVGRPDNVESCQMLYLWVIDQIKRIASSERYVWMEENGEHMDPLRWQLNFGMGVVSRFGVRLQTIREAQASKVTAMVLSHKSEISDYMEAEYGTRIDGRKTKAEEAWHKEYVERHAVKERLKETDIEAYYAAYPHERPMTAEEEAVRAAEQEEADKRYARNARRRRGSSRTRYMSDKEYTRMRQAEHANESGRKSADSINVEPFLKGRKPKGELA